jgi:hypothetical protein
MIRLRDARRYDDNGTMKRASTRSLTETLLRAVEYAQNGDWQRAHAMAQEHEGHPLADWLHAVAHRMEGDVDNALYWYRRCRRDLREGVSTNAELDEMKAVLEEQRSGIDRWSD